MAAPNAFETLVDNLSARRKDREKGAAWVVEHPNWVATMVNTALDNNAGRRQQVSSWIMELYFLPRLEALSDYLPQLLDEIPKVTQESSRRPLSKLLYYYISSDYNKLNSKQIDRVVAIAFDWMIAPTQVATLNFALRILHYYEEHEAWIKEQLIAIVAAQLPHASPGYRSAAREILK